MDAILFSFTKGLLLFEWAVNSTVHHGECSKKKSITGQCTVENVFVMRIGQLIAKCGALAELSG